MKRFALAIVVALGPLALAACAALPAASATTGTPTAGFGQTANVGPLLVRPIALVEDSRCPVNARCVWAGRAIVRTAVAGTGWRETLNLTLGERITTHGTTVALTSVEPGKMAGAEAQPLDYVFGFEGGR